MKQMQDFNTWLFSSKTTDTTQRTRLAALTRLNRAQLAAMSGGLTWFFWEAPKPAVE